MTMPNLPMIVSRLGEFGQSIWPVFWLPVLLWTVAAILTEGVLRLLPTLPALVRYRIRQTVLAALPAGVVGTWLIESPFTTAPLPTVSALNPAHITLPTLTVSPEVSVELSAYAVLGVVTVVAIGAALMQLTRLGIEMGRLYRFSWHSMRAPRSGRLMQRLSTLARQARISRYAIPVYASDGDVPMLLPGRPPRIVLPSWMLDGEVTDRRLDMALTHELVHLDRYDDYAALFEQVIAAIAAGLPMVRFLVRQIEVDREAACDARVLDVLRCRRGAYARLLTDVATKSPSVPAVALSESTSSLEQRLRMMTHHSLFSPSPRLLRTLSFSLLIVLVTSIIACSTESSDGEVTAPDANDKTEQQAPPTSSSPSDSDVFVKVDTPPKLLGGIAALQGEIKYPKEAAEKGIEGRVFVQFVVTKTGEISDAEVVRSLSPELDAQAIKAVRSMTFEPGRDRGEAVPVKMTLPITYRLDDDAS